MALTPNMTFKSENMKFIENEEIELTCPKDLKNKNKFKFILFQIRKYFYDNITIYITIKILFGLLLLGIPLFIFKQIINKNNNKYINNSNYTEAVLPIIISNIICIFIILFLIIIKLFYLFKNKL